MDPTLALLLAFLVAFFISCFCLTVIALVALGYRNSEVAEKAVAALSDFGREAIRKLSSSKPAK
jgi:hypothetical protein